MEHCKVSYISKDFGGDDLTCGFAAFHTDLTDENIATVKEKVPTIGGGDVEWVRPSGKALAPAGL